MFKGDIRQVVSVAKPPPRNLLERVSQENVLLKVTSLQQQGGICVGFMAELKVQIPRLENIKVCIRILILI